MQARALQVPMSVSRLNSSSCFLLVTPSHVFVWSGCGSGQTERELAHDLLPFFKNRTVEEVREGAEPLEFWVHFTLPADFETSSQPMSSLYASSPMLRGELGRGIQPRLFECHNRLDAVHVHEIIDFTQSSLNDEHCMILDTHESIFLWRGSNCPASSRRTSILMAWEYLQHKLCEGVQQCWSVRVVDSGEEPLLFTCHFYGWEPVSCKQPFPDPLEQRRQSLSIEGKTEIPPLGRVVDRKSSHTLL